MRAGRPFSPGRHYKRLLPDRNTKDGLAALLAYQPLASSRVEVAYLAAIQRFARLLAAIRQDLAALTSEIETLAKQHYPDLIAINGLGPLSAGQIIGLVGQRAFRSEAHFTAYSGASPDPGVLGRQDATPSQSLR